MRTLPLWNTLYIYTNLISTSIHGTRKKRPPRQEQEIKVSRIIARGKKEYMYIYIYIYIYIPSNEINSAASTVFLHG